MCGSIGGMGYDDTYDYNDLIELANLDVSKQPIVHNDDGTVSTVRSIGVNIDGQEVLLPTVSPDGRIMSNDEAIEQYRKTGKHLGKFKTAEAANKAALRLHREEEKRMKDMGITNDDEEESD